MGSPIAISIAECAAGMCVTRKHVYHLIKTDPTFPQPFKVGACTRILRVELEEWLANKAKQAREMQVARQARQNPATAGATPRSPAPRSGFPAA